VRIEFLYFEGCPSAEVLLPRVRDLLARADLSDEPELLHVETIEDAERERFLGSPSVRIDGHDIEPGADERTDFGLKCRLYRNDAGSGGVPPDAWVAEAIRSALARA
jgi:hypothetical protein